MGIKVPFYDDEKAPIFYIVFGKDSKGNDAIVSPCFLEWVMAVEWNNEHLMDCGNVKMTTLYNL